MFESARRLAMLVALVPEGPATVLGRLLDPARPYRGQVIQRGLVLVPVAISGSGQSH